MKKENEIKDSCQKTRYKKYGFSSQQNIDLSDRKEGIKRGKDEKGNKN